MLKMLLDLFTFSAVVEAAALTAASRLPRPDQKALETGHSVIWKKAERWTVSLQW